MRIERLDHVALRVGDRERLAEFLTVHLAMRVIEETDRFTLVGADARRGKLTLFGADGRPEPGQPERVGLRVPDLAAVLALLPPGLAVRRPAAGEVRFLAPERLPLAVVERRGLDVEADLDHVVLRARHPMAALNELRHLGFATANGHLEAGDACIEVAGGDPGEPERTALDHLGLLVASAAEHLDEARERGLHVDDVLDTENTFSVFLVGPEGIRLEYVEHKPSFALA